MPKYQEKHQLLDGAVLLYTTVGQKHKVWYVRCKFPKSYRSGYLIRSTGCATLSEAVIWAKDFYLQALTDLKEGITIEQDRGFSHQFHSYLKFIMSSPASGKSDDTVNNFKYFGKYWLEYFKNSDVRHLQTIDFDKYRVWRMEYWTVGAGADKPKPPNVALVPSENTMRQDRQRMKQFFTHLANNRIIRNTPVFNIPSREYTKTRKVGRRDHFTMAEWNGISNRLNHWAFKADIDRLSKNHRYSRQLLYYFCVISANLGTRPGETRGLNWGHINFKKASDNDSVTLLDVYVSPQRKTGERHATGSANAVKYILDLKAMAESYHGRKMLPTDPVFMTQSGNRYKHPEKTFKKILVEWGCYEDNEGRVRNIYSLRGLYITRLLDEGVPVHTVAKLAGTSVKQIEGHYDRSAPDVGSSVFTVKSQKK